LSRSPFIEDIILFVDSEIVVINGIGSSKQIKLPREVIEWLKSNRVARRLLEELITHYKFRRRLCNKGALRSLILLLYSRLNGIPPYKVALKYSISPEQLYRLERGLRSDGLLDLVVKAAY
jgi:hypothetical protein